MSCDNIVLKEGLITIVYLDILPKLAARGWTAYRLRKEGVLPESVLTRLRQGRSVTTETINKICELLDCQPSEIIKWERDE